MGGGSSRAACEDRYHQQFDRDLKNFGSTDRGRIVAELEDFMIDWRSDVSFTDLKRRWDYKLIGRVRGQAIMQIKVARDYRAAVMPVGGAAPRMWILHVYRRQTTNQEEIKRAKIRAQNILEQGET